MAGEITRQEGASPLGAVVTASLAYRRRRGSPLRVVEAVAGAVLIPGDARAGIRGLLRRYARTWAESSCPIVVSVDGDSPAELAAAATELEGVAGVGAIELPLPNLDVVAESIRAVRRACALPIWAKLAPDTPELSQAMALAATAGATAVTIGGGLSAGLPDGTHGFLVGPATLPVILAAVQRAAAEAPLPLIANGGVATPDDARAYLRAGATAVQVGSAQLADPRAAFRVAGAFRPADA